MKSRSQKSSLSRKTKKNLNAVHFISSMSVRYSGASIQRQIVEKEFTLSDDTMFMVWVALDAFYYFLELLVRLGILPALAGIGAGVIFIFDWLFVGWPDDLRLIREAAWLFLSENLPRRQLIRCPP